jgi:hypothetical protein
LEVSPVILCIFGSSLDFVHFWKFLEGLCTFWKLLLGFCAIFEVNHGILCIFGRSS